MNIIFIGSILIVLEVLIIALLVVNMVRKRKFIDKSNILYVLLVFLLSWLMYSIALFYNNIYVEATSTSFISILALAKNALEVFIFDFNVDLLLPIMNSSVIMVIPYSIMLIIASLTTIFTFVVVVYDILNNIFKNKIILKQNGDIILGVSESSKKYNKLNPNSIIWDDKINGTDFKELLNNGFVVYNEKLTANRLAFKLRKGTHHLILFKDSSYSYSHVLNLFEQVVAKKNKKIEAKFEKIKPKLITKFEKEYENNNKNENANVKDKEKAKEKFLQEEFEKLKSNNFLYLHVESSIEEMEAIKEEFADLVGSDINSFVTCFNKYQNIATDFIKNYPISYFMPRNFFNKNYSLKENKKVNVVFVGFGNVNLELFKMMAIQFQFAKEKTTKNKLSAFKIEPVNYYVYDNNDDKLCNKYFTKLDYEFKRDFKNFKLDKMEKICNLKHEKINIYSEKLKQDIENLITEDSYTYIIVSVKSDLENIAFAEHLQNYFSFKQNFKIFTRVKENVFYEKPSAKREITFFGKEDSLYLHNAITNNELITLAQNIKSAHAEKLGKIEEYKFHNLPLIDQYSKINLALSMFFKVGLMGYKLVEKNEVFKLKNYEVCSVENFIENFSHKKLSDMKKDYNTFFDDLASNLMAYIEHSRWNAHYYLSDYKPMDISEFAPKKDGQIGALKSYKAKKHSSLTSYDGIDTLCKYIYLMQKYGKDYTKHKLSEITKEELNSEEFRKIEKYSYDYRILDFITNLANKNYVLVKKIVD